MTDKELWTEAWAELKLTTDSYPTWVKKGYPSSSHWAKAKQFGDQIGAVAPPPPSTTLLWGARMDGDVYGRAGDAPWDAGTWDLFEQHAGRKVDICHFGQPAPWLQPFAAAPFQACFNRGALPLCTMSSDTDSLAAIAQGSRDAVFTTWAQAAAAYGKPILLRWDWEMNGTWYAWGKQPAADYVAAWRHLHDLVRPIAANVEWVWCPNVDFTGATPLASLWPGSQYVERVGVDGYNFGTNPLKNAGWKTWEQVFAPTLTSLKTLAPGKPIVVCETSSTEIGGSKAQWITDMFASLKAHPEVTGLVWFNWNILEGGGRWDWPIESSTTAQAAFKAGVS